MRALIAIAVAVVITFFGMLLIHDGDQPKQVAAVLPAKNANNDNRSECLPFDIATLQFANVPELEAPQWKQYPENPETQQYMGANGHVPLKNFDALDASIDYQMWGPSVSCVSGAGIYAS